MADNIQVDPGDQAGAVAVATDDVAGVHYPLYKPAFGDPDSATQVSPTNPLPSTDAATKAAVDTVDASVSAVETAVAGVDASVDVVNASVSAVETAVTGVDTSVDAVKTSVDAVNTSVAAVDASVDAVKASVDIVDVSVSAVETAVAGVDTSVDAVKASVDTVDASVAAVEAAVDASVAPLAMGEIYEDVDYKYFGEALPGTLITAIGWRVSRMAKVGKRVEWADGNANFDNTYDDVGTVALFNYS